MSGQLVVVSGEARVYGILGRHDAVVIPAHACRFVGFVNDTFTEYRNPSIYRDPLGRRAGLAPSLSYSNHWHGRFYVAVAMQDAAGAEEPFEIWVGNRKLGEGAAREGDNRVHLLVSPEPADFRGGEEISLRFPANASPYRIESLALLRRRPEPAPRELRIENATLSPDPSGGAGALVTWTTSRPALARVFLMEGARQVEEAPAAEPLQNHRVLLRGPVGARSRAVIRAETPDGTLAAEAEARRQDRPSAAPTRRVSVPLIVTTDRRAAAWPVTTGIPFARGQAWDPEGIRVLGPSGSVLPTQARVLSRWPDGSIRWALVDFQADLDGDVERFRVEANSARPSAAPEVRVAVAETSEGITLETGVIALTLSRDGFSLPGTLRLPGEGEPLLGALPGDGILLVDGEGGAYTTACSHATFVVEEAGPLRACIRAEVSHADASGGVLFRSIVRVHAYAGKPWVRVFHTWVNDHTASEMATIRRLALVSTRGARPFVTVRVGRGSRALPARVLQHFDNAYRIEGKEERRGRFPGHVAVTDGARTVAVAVRHFAENYPKGISVTADALTVEICPDTTGVEYAVGGYEEDRLFYYLAGGAYKLRRGMARTHEILYGCFGRAGASALRGEVACFLNPPVVRADPGHVLASGVVGDLAPKDEATAPAYEGYVRRALERYLADRRRLRGVGMLNFGDWFGERRYNWGNMEYDTPWVWLLEFLRGGEERCFALGEQAAWHLADVDTVHAASDAGLVGAQYAHCVGHAGGYYPQGFREAALADGSHSHSHTWVEGLFLYYGLTGHEQIREWAEVTCRRMAGASLNNYDFANCRDSGWLLIHLMAAFSATADPWYLNGARIVVERVLERQRQSGGWERLMVPGHCYCDPPRHRGNATFMVGVLLAGLKRYHLVTGDRRVRRSIIEAARYLVRENWVPAEKVFRYTNCPHIWASSEMNAQVHEGLAYAARLSDDPELRQVLLDSLRRNFSPALQKPEDRVLVVRVPGVPERRFAVEDEGVGKEISLHLRQAPFALSEVRRLKERVD